MVQLSIVLLAIGFQVAVISRDNSRLEKLISFVPVQYRESLHTMVGDVGKTCPGEVRRYQFTFIYPLPGHGMWTMKIRGIIALHSMGNPYFFNPQLHLCPLFQISQTSVLHAVSDIAFSLCNIQGEGGGLPEALSGLLTLYIWVLCRLGAGGPGGGNCPGPQSGKGDRCGVFAGVQLVARWSTPRTVIARAAEGTVTIIISCSESWLLPLTQMDTISII